MWPSAGNGGCLIAHPGHFCTASARWWRRMRRLACALLVLLAACGGTGHAQRPANTSTSPTSSPTPTERTTTTAAAAPVPSGPVVAGFVAFGDFGGGAGQAGVAAVPGRGVPPARLVLRPPRVHARSRPLLGAGHRGSHGGTRPQRPRSRLRAVHLARRGDLRGHRRRRPDPVPARPLLGYAPGE